MTYLLDGAVLVFTALAVVVWLMRGRRRLPPKPELAPPPRAPDPQSQEIEGLILKMDEAMLALDAAGVEVPKPGSPEAEAGPAPADAPPDVKNVPPKGLL
jgi:hypothetical protein